MEFLYKNYLQTSTQISVQSNSLLAENIMLRDPTRQWFSDGYDDDATTASMTITLDETTTISRIALAGMNLKSFRIFYNGATANSFALTSTAMTTASDFTNNTQSAMFLTCEPVAVTSITIDMRTTQTANSEKALGYLLLSNLLLDFDRMPASGGYSPKLSAEQVVHRMSDGGTKINIKDRKRDTDIKLKYITKEFRDDLLEVYEDTDEFVFVAFPTTTAWDEALMPCVWEGDFDGFRHSENNPGAGFDITIKLRETPT